LGLFDRFHRRRTPEAPEPAPPSEGGGFSRSEAAAWLAAMESGKLQTPADVHDQAGWDRYWQAHVEVGAIEQGFNDMMASDPGFVAALDSRGARTILCAGNGLSSEAGALAVHGFDVTVLEISAVPSDHFKGALASPDDTCIAFAPDLEIDPEKCPPMHRSSGRGPRGGGSLSFVVGDLMNADRCPGPFDVVIERRTVQLFRDDERQTALDRLAARLAPRGLLVSHQHSGWWKPDQPREHFAAAWAASRGFVAEGAAGGGMPARAARLIFTTG
jgi:hypothetical protein